MTRTKSIIGALVVCALSICAFAAANASASELTAVTCKEVETGKGNYETNHCNTPKVKEKNFETVALPLNTPTNVTAASTEEEPALRAILGGASVTIKCGSSELIGATLENTEPTEKKHTVTIKATRNTYSNCHAVLMSNEARFCSVSGTTEPGGVGMISTNPLVGMNTGVEHKVIFEAQKDKEGKELPFTKFTIQKKGTNATENECFFNNDVAVEVKGAVEGEANTTKHSHLTFTEANNGTALKANGATAHYIDTTGGVMEGTENTVGLETFT